MSYPPPQYPSSQLPPFPVQMQPQFPATMGGMVGTTGMMPGQTHVTPHAITEEIPPINSGESVSSVDRIKDSAAAAMQTHVPLSQFKLHFVASDFYNGHPECQFTTHHYVSQLTQDLKQCLIFDSDQSDARLIGIEYVVSSTLFSQLPDEEKLLWHSHAFEAKNGLITAPGVPRLIEHPVIQDWGHTYGKTFHFWQIDKTSHTIPLGIPQLMMAPCSVAHVNLELFQRRDKLYSIDTEAEKVSRASLNIPIATDKFADHWAHTSEIFQLKLDREAPGSKLP